MQEFDWPRRCHEAQGNKRMALQWDALIAGIALVYGAGIATGWTLARRATRYMLGGNAR